MATMLPAGFASRRSLADVLKSCLAAVSGTQGTMALPAADRTVVILVDGLGASALRSRAGHARFLSPRLTKATTLASGFPTTTVAALTTLCTGQLPGQHGMVGYTVLDPQTDRVFNQLSGWKNAPDPALWQRATTIFERAGERGIASFAIGPERYRSSPFSQAALRGSQYVGAKTMADRFDAAADILAKSSSSITYLYVPELDMTAHARGWQSDAWISALEEVDAQVARLADRMRDGDAGFVTADHGVLDVPESSHVLFDTVPALVDGVRHVAGDPRCLQLHVEPGAGDDHVRALADAWRHAEARRAWVATKAEAIAAGWFGATVDDAVAARIGDILIAARGQIAYYDSRTAAPSSLAMVGQHGSFSHEEVAVPLIGLGAFAA